MDIDATTEIWQDEMRAKGFVYHDWEAAWRSSLKRMVDEWGRGVEKRKKPKTFDELLDQLEQEEREREQQRDTRDVKAP
jgi:hypothetical protein